MTSTPRLRVPWDTPAEAIGKVYARSPSGCCLHIVVDDGNATPSAVDFCATYAVEQGHKVCAAAAAELQFLTATQLRKLVSLRPWEEP